MIQDAGITSGGSMLIDTGCASALPVLCVNARNAKLDSGGLLDPIVNGDSIQPYDSQVKDTAVECAPDAAVAVIGTGALKIETKNGVNTGGVSVCGATLE